MSELKWIKLEISLFDNDKIKLIQANYKRQFDSVIVMWVRLLCLAGKQNNGGKFLISNDIPFKIEDFSNIWNIRKDKVNSIFNILIEYGMLEYNGNIYSIKNWSVYQSVDKWEKKKAYDREYHRAKRDKEKQEQEKGKEINENVVRLSNDGRIIDKDIDKEEDKDIDKDIDIDHIKRLTTCKFHSDKTIKTDWCYNNCYYNNICDVKEATVINGKKVTPVANWFLECERKEQERRRKEENKK